MTRTRAAWIVTLGLLFFLSGFASYSNAADQKQTTAKGASDKPSVDKAAAGSKVASVNGVAISQNDFDKEFSRYERQMAMMGQASDPAQVGELKKKVLDGLIGREVLKQECQKVGIKVSDAEVDERVAALKKRFPSEKDFTDTLVKMALTEPELKSQFTQDMAIKKLIEQEVAGKVTVSDAETKTYYDSNPDLFKTAETVRASHILIKVDPKAGDADKTKAREKVAAVQTRIQKGEDFAVVAKEVSECPSGANGGDLDYFQRGQMVGPFEEAAFKLKPGEVSDIVESQFGYHLIKVADKKPAETKTYDQVKDELGQYLKQQKVNQQLAQYVDQLKSKDTIETFTK